MIALITSTIVPETYSFFSIEERYQQTIDTIGNLAKVGFENIYLVDNSVSEIDYERLNSSVAINIQLIHSPQYNFTNKGLNEALLILNNLSKLPDDQPIFKISGRYLPTEEFNITNLLAELRDKEILGVGNISKNSNSYFNTRAYLVASKKTLASILELAVEEMIAYGNGIHGFSGWLNLFKKALKLQIGTPFQISIESAFANILRAKTNYKLVEKINIEGFVAGSKVLTFISE